jgi:hypothetical protein
MPPPGGAVRPWLPGAWSHSVYLCDVQVSSKLPGGAHKGELTTVGHLQVGVFCGVRSGCAPWARPTTTGVCDSGSLKAWQQLSGDCSLM